MEEARLKQEKLAREEAEKNKDWFEREKEIERRRAEERISKIEEERHRLEVAIEREKEEKERLEEVQNQRMQNERITALKAQYPSQDPQLTDFYQRMQEERRAAEMNRESMMQREMAIRQSN